jgi:ribose 5-phosphate isomerase
LETPSPATELEKPAATREAVLLIEPGVVVGLGSGSTDLAIDGAVQIDPNGWLIKGGGAGCTSSRSKARARQRLRLLLAKSFSS